LGEEEGNNEKEKKAWVQRKIYIDNDLTQEEREM